MRERAVGRIGVLTNLLSNYPSLKVRTRQPGQGPPPCHSPCQGSCPAGCSRRWDHRALQSPDSPGVQPWAHSWVQVFSTNFLLLALLLTPPSSRPLSTLENTVLELSALKTSQSQSWEGLWDVSFFSDIPRNKQAIQLSMPFFPSLNSSVSKNAVAFIPVHTDLSLLTGFAPPSCHPEHPSCHFAAEDECSPQAQDLFVTALLPPFLSGP